MKTAGFLFAATLAVMLAGCASSTPPEKLADVQASQSVRVHTPGVTGAACVLQTQGGSYVLMSPARVDVPRNAGSLSVTCSKGEHFRGARTVKARHVVENGSTIYSYPENLSVAMTLHKPSLKTKYRVF